MEEGSREFKNAFPQTLAGSQFNWSKVALDGAELPNKECTPFSCSGDPFRQILIFTNHQAYAEMLLLKGYMLVVFCGVQAPVQGFLEFTWLFWVQRPCQEGE